MLKMALVDCVIRRKCCSVDRGRGISPPPRRDLTAQETPSPGICLLSPKNANARESARERGGGGGWAQLERLMH